MQLISIQWDPWQQAELQSRILTGGEEAGQKKAGLNEY